LVFHSDANNLVRGHRNGTGDVFVHGVRTGRTKLVNVSTAGQQGNGFGGFAKISANGRFVTFQSVASNLVPGDTNGHTDIFVHERATSTTTRVSVGAGGAQANNNCNISAISADGRFVAFSSDAQNLVPNDTNDTFDIFVRDRLAGTTRRVSRTASGGQGNGQSYAVSLSGDAGLVAFGSDATNLVPGDTNRRADIFVRGR
jgi:Tol biopolymer transport system component